MTLRYEINPPKITPNSNLSSEQSLKLLDKVKGRVSEISDFCDGIHFTDSVLGIPRISPITTGDLIRKSNETTKITVSLRVRDKDLNSLIQMMEDVVESKLDGVLILKGDPSPTEQFDSGLIPSKTVKYFKELGFDKKMEIYLSLPSNPDFNKIQKKIEAQPTGFITQVIQSTEEVTRIVDYLKPNGFKTIPCILLPSEKNAKSAELLHLDWSEYESSIQEFIKKTRQIAEDVLITSPNDFKFAKEIMSSL